MIISVEEAKKHISTDVTDEVLEGMLQALELSIRGYTNNRFLQMPLVKVEADILDGLFIAGTIIPFSVGDTVHVTYGADAVDCGVYTVKEVNDLTFTVNEDIPNMDNVRVYKVQYKADVKLGAINMLKWRLENGDKVGVQSETLSRHSVTYFNMDGDNSLMGYPKSLLGFLKPYMKARF